MSPVDVLATRRWLDRRSRSGAGTEAAAGHEQARAADAQQLGRAVAAGSGALPPGQDAVSWWRAAAEGGNTEAMVGLGGALVDDPDGFAEGERWLRAAAEGGDANGKLHFGRLLLFKGHEDEAEPWLDAAIESAPSLAMELVYDLRMRGATELATKWARKAAEAGDPAAAVALSTQAAERGDHEEAQKWAEHARGLGDDDAELVLAVAAHERGDEAAERQWIDRAVAAGHPLAAAVRGMELVAADRLEDARPLLEQAAQNDVDAAFAPLAGIYLADGRTEDALGLIERAMADGDPEIAYLFGAAVAERSDWAGAARAFELAARRGHAGAMLMLGRALLHEQRPAEAADWLSRPPAQALPDAGLLLGMAQAASGDRETAKETYAAAARAGDGRAAHKLGLLYHEEGDVERGLAWYERAAGDGEASAMFNLGLLLEQRDPDGAERWFVRAAEHGHVEAPHSVAIMALKSGRNADAVAWLQQAVAAGNPRSVELLAALEGAADARRSRGRRGGGG